MDISRFGEFAILVVGSRVFGRQAQKELGFHDGLNHGGLLMSHAFVDF